MYVYGTREAFGSGGARLHGQPTAACDAARLPPTTLNRGRKPRLQTGAGGKRCAFSSVCGITGRLRILTTPSSPPTLHATNTPLPCRCYGYTQVTTRR